MPGRFELNASKNHSFSNILTCNLYMISCQGRRLPAWKWNWRRIHLVSTSQVATVWILQFIPRPSPCLTPNQLQRQQIRGRVGCRRKAIYLPQCSWTFVYGEFWSQHKVRTMQQLPGFVRCFTLRCCTYFVL